ncbi:hypothetical protein JQV19_08545 [Sulfitobacter mediterraneus]|uniref:hypothetical protein n=1 Tax=Sulfitobacter mediterraneus TaxID=83219 RepID=UPI00193ACEB9|nr:hypothetical protein [Sulfitobacter mediterraneus]MBM1556695.1 hypothetical protein [Sulfitobacter mediterraneus]MBM1570108.1 hypothetical protein [Sulfitobacter mediterraneus]MBM1574065.1 hypothetical protein [Sulfitobacter mediterraneus]MBM1577850.1 hypothetical protein [Sulfitobacter mediterraneus]MBM1579653.1 hypothetical protein [Sulfitobacter mediterraneus]
MSLIDDIRKDMQVDDPEADRGWKAGPVIWDSDSKDAAYILSGRKIASPLVYRRIARVPQMEAALLAAEELAASVGRSDSWFEIDAALDAYLAATGAS